MNVDPLNVGILHDLFLTWFTKHGQNPLLKFAFINEEFRVYIQRPHYPHSIELGWNGNTLWQITNLKNAELYGIDKSDGRNYRPAKGKSNRRFVHKYNTRFRIQNSEVGMLHYIDDKSWVSRYNIADPDYVEKIILDFEIQLAFAVKPFMKTK